ncbi:hypothetical protein GLOTRDRAFT_137956 [Gloeophyllum trabeum ATCC 11539]|uniref:MYND-type domain-containing protein n=1 Tax=Gloeophyllum trabeum (strain ATCC 11539 / FP-39264 / Madison 617) TaxID=670483 RepID=S7RNP5_GLOTA|nr:uncharacterized protein GLOTRDRAFT_137956 [Gloeophyllum trabeum ATCC 11539]EPQ56125.1 hypothetical protein GLOTRDRAFT_137956 [Gloeophyllum trabeum ATCC 11539]
MPTNTSKPLIPPELLDQLRTDPTLAVDTTMSTTPKWHKIRTNLVKMFTPGNMTADDILALEGGIRPSIPQHNPFTPADARTWLHYAAHMGSPCVALEIIRLGGTIDLKDAHGYTPLALGMWVMASYAVANIGRRRGVSWCSGADPVAAERMAARTRWVCRLLVEQHADVNVVVDDMAPLEYACFVQDWEMIELLLTHGADAGRRDSQGRLPMDRLSGARADKKRFLKLVAETKGRPRPARPCPCWSGKALAACHAAGPQPYPAEYTCRCGSGKPYARCCTKRGIEYWEEWDEKDQWIRNSERKRIKLKMKAGSMDPADVLRMQANMGRLQQDAAYQADLRRLGPQGAQAMFDDYFGKIVRLVREEMVPRGVVDPAFAYAMPKTQMLPLPKGRSFCSKQDGTELATAWNAAVDAYIVEVTDARPRAEIERAAKINTYCGALFRRCEGAGCGRLEGRDVERLKLIEGVGKAVYCGRACQASAWKKHKEACEMGAGVEQMLPSQTAIQESLMPGLWKQALRASENLLSGTA